MSRSVLRTRSGKTISNHGKRDDRISGLKKGTLLKNNKICYPGKDGYVTGMIVRVVQDSRGISQKNLRVITKGCLVQIMRGGTPALVRVTSRTHDHLVGILE